MGMRLNPETSVLSNHLGHWSCSLLKPLQRLQRFSFTNQYLPVSSNLRVQR